MIPIESFRMWRLIDFIAIIIISIIWTITTSLLVTFPFKTSFFMLLLITSILASFVALFIRRAGSITAFFTISGLLTFWSNNFGTGWEKVIILMVVGIIFELSFLLIKIKINSVPIDIVLGAAFSNLAIPILILIFIETKASELLKYAFNFAATAFIIGIIGAIIAYIVWFELKRLKWVIKFEYKV